jgi:hypothetical protein
MTIVAHAPVRRASAAEPELPRLAQARDGRVAGRRVGRAPRAASAAYSRSVGWVEADRQTARPLRAMHRGQCSIVNQLALGLIVNPQRGQFQWIVPTRSKVGSRGGRGDIAILSSRRSIGPPVRPSRPDARAARHTRSSARADVGENRARGSGGRRGGARRPPMRAGRVGGCRVVE